MPSKLFQYFFNLFNLSYILCLLSSLEPTKSILVGAQKSGTILTETFYNTCSLDDLNHSILVECNTSNCERESTTPWPSSRKEVIHMTSSREGDRFHIIPLNRLIEIEDENFKPYDINTTIQILANEKYQSVQFGTSLDLTLQNKQQEVVQDVNLENILKNSIPIFRDLFSSEGINLSILRLSLNQHLLTTHNVSKFLLELDESITNSLKVSPSQNDQKIKVILSLNILETNRDVIDNLKIISDSCKAGRLQHLECWAIALNEDWIKYGSNSEGVMDWLENNLFESKLILANARKMDFYENLTNVQSKFINGLVIKLNHSSPYNILEYLTNKKSSSQTILNLPRDRYTRDLGDWQNAQDYFAEILNNMKHGSNGIIEENSSIDIMSSNRLDCSIYNLQESHGIHFRGPIYYAMGHFSKYLQPNSIRIGQKIESQPNSFAKDFVTFLTPNGHYIVVGYNNNDHLIPTKLLIDGRVVAQANLMPKSFSTFVIKT